MDREDYPKDDPVTATLEELHDAYDEHAYRAESLARDVGDDSLAPFLAERLDEERWELQSLSDEILDAEERALLRILEDEGF